MVGIGQDASTEMAAEALPKTSPPLPEARCLSSTIFSAFSAQDFHADHVLSAGNRPF